LSFTFLQSAIIGLQVEGEVTYNNVPLKDFVVERTASYIDQVLGLMILSVER
jgi:hypothetical protein